MSDENKRAIEINGIKMEIDLRHTKRIDEFRVGDRVKMLKKSYGDTYEVHSAVIVSFDAFEKLPTIVLAYLTSSGLLFAALNAQTKDIEIAPAFENDIEFSKEEILRRMNNDIEVGEQKVAELRERKRFFMSHFGKFFGESISE